MAYPFDLIGLGEQAKSQKISEALKQRTHTHSNFKQAARFFCLDDGLREAINTAIAVGEPLILTGEAGTGKTQSAYYIAELLALGDVLHFQVKSDTKAKDLLYQFDTVRYFHDAQYQADKMELDKYDYLSKGALWEALQPNPDSKHADKPKVVLIDEIDKAPRDFPNDLLHELDQMNFTIAELGLDDSRREVKAGEGMRPIVFITSNSERQLPDAFLRRCVFHHIRFDEVMLEQIVDKHKAGFAHLGDDVIRLALNRFIELTRRDDFRKRPATGELLVWLRTLALWTNAAPEKLEQVRLQLADDDKPLPCLGVLFKDRNDLEIAQYGY